jgi:hypothetical protein
MPGTDGPALRRRVSSRLAALPTPWLVLGGLVVAQWIVVAGVATSVRHNGWLYHDGGDGTWYYTTAWVMGEGHIPNANLGYGYPLLIAPFTWLTGPNRLAGLPLIVLLNVIVLAPIALACVYGLARAIAGRRYAYAVAALWVVMPVLAIPYFHDRFQPTYLDVVLPSLVGLTTNGDFPSLVCLLVAAYFLFRTLAGGSRRDALAAGLAAGFAVAIKPANLLFLPGPFLALAVARRPRETLLFAAALVPALLTVTLWKYRGLGHVPVLGGGSSALAAGTSAAPPVPALDLDKYFSPDWDQVRHNLEGLRTYTWSRALLGWSLLAGLIGVGRRALPAAALLGGWLAAFVVAKGSREGFSVGTGSFLTHMIAAAPAIFLLIAAIPLLVPRAGPRLAERGRAAAGSWRPRAATIAVAVAGVLSASALVLIATLDPVDEPDAVFVPFFSQYVPANAFGLAARPASDGTVRLDWPGQRFRGADVAYAIFRTAEDPLTCRFPPHAAADCVFSAEAVGHAYGKAFHDHPTPGRWSYRVAVMSAPFGPPATGDVVMFSRSVSVDVR